MDVPLIVYGADWCEDTATLVEPSIHLLDAALDRAGLRPTARNRGAG